MSDWMEEEKNSNGTFSSLLPTIPNCFSFLVAIKWDRLQSAKQPGNNSNSSSKNWGEYEIEDGTSQKNKKHCTTNKEGRMVNFS